MYQCIIDCKGTTNRAPSQINGGNFFIIIYKSAEKTIF